MGLLFATMGTKASIWVCKFELMFNWKWVYSVPPPRILYRQDFLFPILPMTATLVLNNTECELIKVVNPHTISDSIQPYCADIITRSLIYSQVSWVHKKRILLCVPCKHAYFKKLSVLCKPVKLTYSKYFKIAWWL